MLWPVALTIIIFVDFVCPRLYGDSQLEGLSERTVKNVKRNIEAVPTGGAEM